MNIEVVCRHCQSERFNLSTPVDGKEQISCLDCGDALGTIVRENGRVEVILRAEMIGFGTGSNADSQSGS